MTTNFPASLDSLTNPTSSDSLNSPSHSAQHANVNDAVEALQAKVGADSSAVTTSLDYKVAQLEGRNTAGLVHISRTAIGSAVSSITVSDAFSADYDVYKIIVTGGAASANGTFALKLGATASGYKYQQLYGTYSSTSGALGNGSSIHWAYAGAHLTVGLEANIDLDQPFLTTRSFYRCYAPFSTSAGWVGGYLDDATSYTAFTLTTSTGTVTGGNIDVYGYAKA